nr:hypothetical protein [uncultured Pseudomonas sp.]
MAANTIPTVSTLPPAPTRADAPADFTTKADTFVAALPKLVTQVNLTVSGMNDQASYLDQLKTDVNGYKTAAAQSAEAASTQAGNAQTYAGQAMTYRDSAQAAAAAAQSAAGLPSLVGKAGQALSVNPDEKGVSWAPVGAVGYQEFTSSGTFPKPAGARYFLVELISGGSSGAVYAGTAANIVEGGLGGDFNTKILRAADVPSSVAVIVGEGGLPVTSSNSSGQSGGDTTFGTLLKAVGAIAPVITAGNQTPPAARDGDMRGGRRGGSIKGGGSGASYIASSGLLVNAPGLSSDAGQGGDKGAAGAYPGGGGGPNFSNQAATLTSGAGGKGRCRIWWW